MSAGPHSAVWHDIECGAYRADLALWRELAHEAASSGNGARVLDIGAGTGRVSLDLARLGHRVTALDRDPQLLDVLEQRADEAGFQIETVAADAREIELDRSFDLIAAPMQLVQLLGGAAQRRRFLDRAVRHLRPNGLLAAALMELADEPIGDDYRPPLPDMGEIGGWVYSSLPVAITPLDRGRAIALERLRSAVSPAGEVTEQRDSVRLRLLSPDRLEREGSSAGLMPAGLRTIAATADHVGSVVVLLRRPAD